MNYLFRVLNEQDIKTLSEKEGIKAKNIAPNKTLLKEIFQTINPHILNGSEIKSSWISISKSFKKIAVRYNTAHEEYECPRQPIAVIKNHFFNSIVNKNGINIFETGLGFIKKYIDVVWSSKVEEIEQIAYDLSNRKIAKLMGNIGLILTKEGKLCGNNVLSLGFSSDSEEIIILNKISQDEIVTILSPLETDLLYAVDNNDFESLLNLFNKNIFDYSILNQMLTKSEIKLFRDLYVHNLHMKQIAYQLWQINQETDIFSIFLTLKNLKKSLIKKLLNSNHLKSTDFIIEDELIISKTSKKVNQSISIEYGEVVQLVKPKINYSRYQPENCKLVTLSIKDEPIINDNTYWLINDEIYTCYLTDKLVKHLDKFTIDILKEKKR